MRWEDALALTEEVVRVKFKYKGKNSHDPKPDVALIDADYPGQKNWKNKDDSGYVMGYNLNYISNKKDALKSIEDISDFAAMLSANKLERYKRISYFAPETLKFLRTYIRDRMEDIRRANKKIKISDVDDSVSF